MAIYKITLSASSWTQSVAALYYNTATPGKFYTDTAATSEIARLTIPTRECYKFDGFYSASSSGTQYIDEDGNFTAALLSLSITGAKTFYVHQTQWSYKITLNDYNGSGGQGEIFKKKTMETGDAALYVDYLCTIPVDTVTKPTRDGYVFKGYYNGSTTPGAQYIDEDGVPLANLEAVTAAKTIYAQWQANTYTLTFDYDGGTVSTTSKTVTYGSAVGTLPTTTKGGAGFDGWYIGDTKITSATVWNYTADKEATAKWTRYFGTVVDFFGMASNALVPIASTAGDTRHRVAVSHGGKYESGVNEVGKVWRNPSVTYVVKANTTVAVQLGKAWKPRNASGGEVNPGASNIAISGYMITTVEIVTEVGKFPTVTVSAVANEGANAVNNFTVNANKFNVSVPVVARSKAQNLLGAISGGGHLQRCTLVATCDPVVCEENLMPCASDIVNGRYELAAETLAAENNAAPTMASASGSNGGFALLDDPKQTSESDFVRYTIEARKEMA